MANLGIMLGASTPGVVQGAKDALGAWRDYQLTSGIPKPGEDDPDDPAQKQAIAAEAQRLGLSFDPSLDRPGQLSAINGARRAQGGDANQGDFQMPAASKMTPERYQAAVAQRLYQRGDQESIRQGMELDRNAALTGLTKQQSQMIAAKNYQEQQFRGLAKIQTDLANGTITDDQARVALGALYNNNSHEGADGHFVLLQPGAKGAGVTATIVNQMGQPVHTATGKNTSDLISQAMQMISPEMYNYFQDRQSKERISDKTNEAHLKATGISAGAHLAGVRMQVDARRAEAAENRAFLTSEHEKDRAILTRRMDLQEPEIKAQTDEIRARADKLIEDNNRKSRLDKMLDDYSNLLLTDPSGEKARATATRLSAQHPELIRKVEETDPTTGAKKVTSFNPFMDMLEAAQPRLPGPDAIKAMSSSLQRSYPDGMTPDQVTQAAQEYARVPGRRASDFMALFPQLNVKMLKNVTPAAPAPDTQAGARVGGIRSGASTPDWAHPYGSGRGYGIRQDTGISRRGQE